MTVTEAAEIIGVSGRRVRQWLADGTLSGRQVTPRFWLVDPVSVRRHAKIPRPKMGRPRTRKNS